MISNKNEVNMKEHQYKAEYGRFGQRSLGHKPNYSCCAEEVQKPMCYYWLQCTNKNGYGPNKIYCKKHAKGKTL